MPKTLFSKPLRRQQATATPRDVIADIRSRKRGLDPDELGALIGEGPTAFYQLRVPPSASSSRSAMWNSRVMG